MIILTIALISIIQLIAYVISFKLKVKMLNIVILISVLICYYTLIPEFFFPEPVDGETNCGLPTMAVNFSFWTFGTISAIGTHILGLVLKALRFSQTKN